MGPREEEEQEKISGGVELLNKWEVTGDDANQDWEATYLYKPNKRQSRDTCYQLIARASKEVPFVRRIQKYGIPT